jgi:hypothetical protein
MGGMARCQALHLVLWARTMPSLIIVVNPGMLFIAMPHSWPSAAPRMVSCEQHGQIHPPAGEIDGTTARRGDQYISGIVNLTGGRQNIFHSAGVYPNHHAQMPH